MNQKTAIRDCITKVLNTVENNLRDALIMTDVTKAKHIADNSIIMLLGELAYWTGEYGITIWPRVQQIIELWKTIEKRTL